MSWGSRSRSSRRDGAEEVPAAALLLAMLLGGRHVDGLVPHLGLGLGRADVDAHAAAGAVVGRHLDGDAVAGQVLGAEGDAAEAFGGARRAPAARRPSCGSTACGQTIAHLPHWMQTCGIPDGICRAMARFSYLVVPVGNVPSAGSALTGSRSPSPAMSSAVTRLTNSGASSGTIDRRRHVARDPLGHFDAGQFGQRAVDGGEVALDDGRPAPAVGLLDRLLDVRDRLRRGQRSGELEEAGLHHRVDAVAQAGLARDRVGVDDPELELLVDELLLDVARQVVPDLLGPVGAVEQEGRVRAWRSRAPSCSRAGRTDGRPRSRRC